MSQVYSVDSSFFHYYPVVCVYYTMSLVDLVVGETGLWIGTALYRRRCMTLQALQSQYYSILGDCILSSRR